MGRPQFRSLALAVNGGEAMSNVYTSAADTKLNDAGRAILGVVAELREYLGDSINEPEAVSLLADLVKIERIGRWLEHAQSFTILSEGQQSTVGGTGGTPTPVLSGDYESTLDLSELFG